MTAIAMAVGGLVVGALLPTLLGALPDRTDVPDRDVEPGGRVRTPYRVLAARRGLRPALGVATAVTWGILAAARGWGADLPAYLVVAALGVAAAYVDLREHRLPDPLTSSALAAAGLLLAVAAAVDGDWSAYARAWIVAAVMFAAYLGLAMLRPADLGLGDVKLAAVVGLVTGWLGWGIAVVGAFLGFLLGGLAGVALVLARRAGRRTAIPFGPFMLAGALVAVAQGGTLLDAYLGR
jgi:leader peptidase (prepilin peptidase)/N-methyltransferase